MNKILLLFFILFSFINTNAQPITVRLIDDKNKGVPYAVIYSTVNKNVVFSDSLGEFTITLKQTPDTLLISQLSYKTDTLVLNTRLLNKTSLTKHLNKNEVLLNELNIIGRNKKQTENQKNATTALSKINDKIHSFFYNCASSYTELGRKFSLSEQSEFRIDKIRIYLGEEGKFNAPFIVKIYSVNNEGLPDSLLSTNPIILRGYKSKWNEFDLSKHQIVISKKSFIITLNWINLEEFSFNKKNNCTNCNDNKCFGATVGQFKNNEGSYERFYPNAKWIHRNFAELACTPAIDLIITKLD